MKFLFSTEGRISASQYAVLAVLFTILWPLPALLWLVISSSISFTLPNIAKIIVFVAIFVFVFAFTNLDCCCIDGKAFARFRTQWWLGTVVFSLVLSSHFECYTAFYLIFCKGEPMTNRFGHRPAPAPKPLAAVCYALIFWVHFILSKPSLALPCLERHLPQIIHCYRLKVQYAVHNQTRAQVVSKKFYSIAHSDILLSRTKVFH